MLKKLERTILNHFSDTGNQFVWAALCNALVVGLAVAIRFGQSPTYMGPLTAMVITCILFWAGTLFGQAIPGKLRMTYEGQVLGGMAMASALYLIMIAAHVYKCMFSHSDVRLMIAAIIALAAFLVNLLGSSTIIQNRAFLHYRE
jgi:hypothetical protein